MPTDEEQRAIDYQRDMLARERGIALRAIELRGSTTAAHELRRNWIAVTANPDRLAIRDRTP